MNIQYRTRTVEVSEDSDHEVKTEHYTSTFVIPCSIFCGSLLKVGKIRTNTVNSMQHRVYAKKLRNAEVPENQAGIHAEAIAELIDEQLETKKDLQILEANVTAKIVRWVAGMLVARQLLLGP